VRKHPLFPEKLQRFHTRGTVCVCAYNLPCLLPLSLVAFLLHNSVTLPAATVLSESAPSISPACLSSSSCVCCELLLLPSLQLSSVCVCVCVFCLVGFLLLLACLLWVFVTTNFYFEEEEAAAAVVVAAAAAAARNILSSSSVWRDQVGEERKIKKWRQSDWACPLLS
jgi:putative flippase GtrA